MARLHLSSLAKMEYFVQKYLQKYSGKNLTILDIGSQDVNGTYRQFFVDKNWRYVGCDIVQGNNVDIVLQDVYDWREISTGSCDVVITGQTFEHIEYPWVTMLEISRVMAVGGLCCIIAPAAGPEHKYPLDCWRIYPDGFRALAKYASLEVVEVFTEWNGSYSDGSEIWKDSVLIARKPPLSKEDDKIPAPRNATSTMSKMENMLDAPLREVLAIMQDRIVTKTSWFGVQALKSPLDFWVYQELIFERQPDFIIEIGNNIGGSSLALAHLLDLIGHGKLICIDISHDRIAPEALSHPRIHWIEGDAIEVLDSVRALVKDGARVLVIEDSSHEYQNTLNVLRSYSGFIQPGDYFIVEDSICHHGLNVGPNPGSFEAIHTFLKENSNFAIDHERESFMVTWNPHGYLKRKCI